MVEVKKLNDRQKRAADEYLAGKGKTEAYHAAGYRGKTAHLLAWKLFERPEVKEYVAKKQAAMAKKLELKQEDIIAGLYEEATFKGEGSSHGARVNAWVQLGKNLGMFAEKSETNVNVRISEIRRIIVDPEHRGTTIEHRNGEGVPAVNGSGPV